LTFYVNGARIINVGAKNNKNVYKGHKTVYHWGMSFFMPKGIKKELSVLYTQNDKQSTPVKTFH